MTEEEGALLYQVAKLLDVHGRILLEDDLKDFGYFAYTGRPKGDPAIGYGTGEHHNPVHHWQAGMFLRAAAKIMGLVAINETLKEEEDPTRPFSALAREIP